MGKIQWKPGNMIYPLPAVIVTCGENEEEYNGLTVAWTGTICTNPPMTYISIRPSRHSYEIIKKQGGFVINLTTEDMAFATDYLGVRSGSKEDKLSKMNLDYDIGEIIKAPLLKKSPVCIECRTTEIKELGSHHMFMAEVVKVHVDEYLLDANNKFHLEQSKPIVYSHGNYFGLGKHQGKFGYSVEKKKKKIKKDNRKRKQ
jgi:flavin reductase (DIM6/NTAB) family NADH-FMN oxidoreductase RutF